MQRLWRCRQSCGMLPRMGAGKGTGSSLVAFRGTELRSAHFARIQRLIDTQPGITREEVARRTCGLFGWRRPNGALPVRSVRELLVRIDRSGMIELPGPRGAQGRARCGYQGPSRRMAGASAGDVGRAASALGPATRGMRLLVRPVHGDELVSWHDQMQRFHYLGSSALVGESIRYVAYLDGELVSLLSWGSASLCNGPRERYVGWDRRAKQANLHRVVCNTRFLVLPWCHRPSLASRVLAASLRRLSRDWEQLYGHDVVLAETFVDGQFLGTCYRASNWAYVGETKGWSKRGAEYRFHGQKKSVWLYELRDDFRNQLCAMPVSRGRPHKAHRMQCIDMERMPLHGEGGLFELLRSIPDLRKRRGIRHKLEGVLGLAICATLAGARSCSAIAEWTAEQSRAVLLQMGCQRGKPPCERTIRRALKNVDVAEIDRRVGSWMMAQQGSLAGVGVALDGKTLRGSRDGEGKAVHLLSAVVHGSGLVVGQVNVDSKTNEITCVAPLLKDMDIKGAVVTTDALLTQTAIADHIVREKEANYVLTVKGNQPTLKNDIESLNLDAFPPSAQNRGQGPRTNRDT